MKNKKMRKVGPKGGGPKGGGREGWGPGGGVGAKPRKSWDPEGGGLEGGGPQFRAVVSFYLLSLGGFLVELWPRFKAMARLKCCLPLPPPATIIASADTCVRRRLLQFIHRCCRCSSRCSPFLQHFGTFHCFLHVSTADCFEV